MPQYAYDFESPIAEYFWTNNITVLSSNGNRKFKFYTTDEGEFCETPTGDILKRVDGHFQMVISAWEGQTSCV